MKTLLKDLNLGEVTLVASRPSVGKTSLALTLAKAMAEGGVGVHYCSLELPADTLSHLVLREEIRMHELQSGNFDDEESRREACSHVKEASGKVKAFPFYVGDSVLGVDDIVSQIEVAKNEHQVGLVVVDYLQLCVDIGNDENLALAVRRFREIAKRLELRIVVLCQLKMDVKDRNPRLSDVAAMEPHADNVWLLRREGEQLIVDVAKNRNGGTRECPIPICREDGMLILDRSTLTI